MSYCKDHHINYIIKHKGTTEVFSIHSLSLGSHTLWLLSEGWFI